MELIGYSSELNGMSTAQFVENSRFMLLGTRKTVNFNTVIQS